MSDPLSEAVDAATPTTPPPYADVLARRDRRRARRRAVLTTAGAVVLVGGVLAGTAALGGDPDRGAGPVATPSGAPTPTAEESADVPEWDGTGAPPVFLDTSDGVARLDPWGYCWDNACVDGSPRPPFDEVGDRPEVTFSFPLPGWEFDATFTPLGAGTCSRSFTVPALSTGEHSFVLGPGGPPGDYQVDLFGRAPRGGDVITTFRWGTTETGHLPEPRGYVGLVTDSGDGIEAYPLEVGLSDLGVSPKQATVTVTATDADGDTETIGPIEAERDRCGEGQVFFREGDGGAAGPTDLGPGPVTYRAEVVLDGTTYVGTGVWPRDERADEAPYTDLEFDPPLPAYEGD